MAIGFLSPIGGAGWQFFTNSGLVLSGGQIFTYLAGTTTPAATYTTSSLGTPNSNPIILDSAGRPPNEIWLQQGIQYKFIIEDSLGNPLSEGTFDNISGVNDVSLGGFSEWVANNLIPTYISATQFSVPGNQTSIFTVKRRILATVAAGTVYGEIIASTFGSGITTVTVLLDTGSLDSGLSTVQYGFTDPTHSSINVLLNVQSFSSSGTYTPTNGTNKIWVRCQGGGGGGGGSVATNSSQISVAQGGSAGSYSETFISSAVAAQTITIGAGGAGGTSGGGGSNGGTTSFGSVITCPGGPGGQGGVLTTASIIVQGSGVSSISTGGSILNTIGAAGLAGFCLTAANGNYIGGAGAPSDFGGGGQGAINAPGNNASSPGSGGGAASAAQSTAATKLGGNGSGGIVIIFEYV
jgi:hypothetical protein